MTYMELHRMIGLPALDTDTLFCIRYLEDRGYRFCVDFGYTNAKHIAAAVARHHDLNGKRYVI